MNQVIHCHEWRAGVVEERCHAERARVNHPSGDELGGAGAGRTMRMVLFVLCAAAGGRGACQARGWQQRATARRGGTASFLSRAGRRSGSRGRRRVVQQGARRPRGGTTTTNVVYSIPGGLSVRTRRGWGVTKDARGEALVGRWHSAIPVGGHKKHTRVVGGWMERMYGPLARRAERKRRGAAGSMAVGASLPTPDGRCARPRAARHPWRRRR